MEKPIEIDTIPGMDTNSDEDWLNFLLRGIIKGTGFPANYIDATNEVDFAKTVVMQNAIFVRSLVSDQEDFEEQFTSLIRKLYINEFDDGTNSDDIRDQAEGLNVIFPRPRILNLTNINDHISTASQTIDFLTATYIDDASSEPDDAKTKLEFKRSIAKEVIPSLDWDKIDKLFKDAQSKVKEKKLSDKVNTPVDAAGGEDMDMGGMGDY